MERRLQRLKERLQQSDEPDGVIRQERPPVCRLPAYETRKKFGLDGLAILVVFGRVVCGRPAEEGGRGCQEIIEEFGN